MACRDTGSPSRVEPIVGIAIFIAVAGSTALALILKSPLFAGLEGRDTRLVSMLCGIAHAVHPSMRVEGAC